MASEMINLDIGSIRRLIKPHRSISVSIPIRRDNGEIEVYDGYRVQYNMWRGPSKGGVRFHPDVTLEEVTALSRSAGEPVDLVLQGNIYSRL